MANADVEAVDFEPEDDDLMDEDGEASPRAAPLPKLKSAITASGASSLKKTKGRGFREDLSADRNSRLAAASDFDALNSSDGLEPQRCQSLSLSPDISLPYS